jgi:hypothetical protein
VDPVSSANKGWFEPVWTPIYDSDPGDEQVEGRTIGSDIALEASEIIEERGRGYGPPSENHSCTADLWSSYLERRYGYGMILDAEDVCWLNILQKISRQANTRKRDNLLDVIGFAINVDMLD